MELDGLLVIKSTSTESLLILGLLLIRRIWKGGSEKGGISAVNPSPRIMIIIYLPLHKVLLQILKGIHKCRMKHVSHKWHCFHTCSLHIPP